MAPIVAANVRAARTDLGLRQVDLANDLGWSRPTVSAIEAGTRRISIADAAALCSSLKISLGDLLKGADPNDLEMLGL